MFVHLLEVIGLGPRKLYALHEVMHFVQEVNELSLVDISC